MFSNPEFLKKIGGILSLVLAGCANPSAPPPDAAAAVAAAAPATVAEPAMAPSPLLPASHSAAVANEMLALPLPAHEVEIRHLKDLLEKQTQQTRELQHKLDQTLERLKALKAIERSLTQHAPAAKPALTTPRGALAPAP
jgi:TolA-binding protein